MEQFSAKLGSRIKRTADIESFRFLPPERIEFAPGQFLQLIFDAADPNNKELNKYLSFSSSPLREYIEVTKRLSRSAFSERLKSLSVGDEVFLKAPMGNCVFKDEYSKIAFLIGGIGITPVISILEYIVDRGLATDVALFYSNKTEEDIAFRKELDLWQGSHKNIRIFYAVTDCQPADSKCFYGRIDKDLVVGSLGDYPERKIFIFGPPVMVNAMNGACVDIGCKKDNIKIENFIGY